MNKLRPKKLSDIIGQEDTKEAIKISIKSAKRRGDSFPHTLVSAPAGIGKSTVCYAIANEMGKDCKTILGANITNFKQLISTFLNVQEGDVIFIDEIHRMDIKTSEALYTIMEDFRMDIPVKQPDGSTETLSYNLPRFTLLGATTEAGALAEPLRDRFKLKFSLEVYDELTLACLIENNCKKLNVLLSDDAILSLAEVSRGTPRIANGLLEWVRDYQIAKGIRRISRGNLLDSLALMGIDPDGSTEDDRKYLNFLKKQKHPVGVNTIASSINIHKDTITNSIEPYLLQKNLILKTPKGRVAV